MPDTGADPGVGHERWFHACRRVRRSIGCCTAIGDRLARWFRRRPAVESAEAEPEGPRSTVSTTIWILVLNPPRERPIAWVSSPVFRLQRADARGSSRIGSGAANPASVRPVSRKCATGGQRGPDGCGVDRRILMHACHATGLEYVFTTLSTAARTAPKGSSGCARISIASQPSYPIA